MSTFKIIGYCCGAITLCASPLVAQNSRINEAGEKQMNDAAPLDDLMQDPKAKLIKPSNFQLFPPSQSPDGAATGSSSGEDGVGIEDRVDTDPGR